MVTKKGMGAVVATALLLVVAVVGVVTFQTWFNTYSSSLQNEVETQSSTSLNTRIDRVIGDTLYFRNGGNENISIDRVVVGGQDCNISQNTSSGMNNLKLGNCTNSVNESVTEVVVYTEDGIYSQKIFLDSVTSSSSEGGSSFSLDCSLLPGEWSAVPGNDDLGTDDFCVMTYEAKDVGGTATSQPSQTPWVSINQTDARAACSDLGPNYQLITDAQWVTMARNIENQPENWADGTIGSEVSLGGGLKRGNVEQSDSVSYDGANPADRSIDTNPLAMHNLSTGDVVWDVSGNVWDWTNDTTDDAYLGTGGFGWHEWTEVNESTYGYLQSFYSTFDSTNGIGQVYPDTYTNRAFGRGGYWISGDNAGAFALRLDFFPDYANSIIGFRCSYTN